MTQRRGRKRRRRGIVRLPGSNFDCNRSITSSSGSEDSDAGKSSSRGRGFYSSQAEARSVRVAQGLGEPIVPLPVGSLQNGGSPLDTAHAIASRKAGPLFNTESRGISEGHTGDVDPGPEANRDTEAAGDDGFDVASDAACQPEVPAVAALTPNLGKSLLPVPVVEETSLGEEGHTAGTAAPGVLGGQGEDDDVLSFADEPFGPEQAENDAQFLAAIQEDMNAQEDETFNVEGITRGAEGGGDCAFEENEPDAEEEIEDAPDDASIDRDRDSLSPSDIDEDPVWVLDKSVFQFLNPFKLYGYLLRCGTVRMDQDSYNRMNKLARLILGPGNADRLRPQCWTTIHPKNEESPDEPLTGMQLSKGPQVFPDIRTIQRNSKLMYKSLTLRVHYIAMHVNTAAAGGLKVAKHHAKAMEKCHRPETSHPRTLVGVVMPSDIVKQQMLVRPLWRAKLSTARGSPAASAECIDDILFFHGRHVLYDDLPSVDAIQPLRAEWPSSVKRSASPDASWRWTQVRVGSLVLVEADTDFQNSVPMSLHSCAVCNLVSSNAPKNSHAGHVLRFGVQQAVEHSRGAESHLRVTAGRLQGSWLVGGAETWGDVNRYIQDVCVIRKPGGNPVGVDQSTSVPNADQAMSNEGAADQGSTAVASAGRGGSAAYGAMSKFNGAIAENATEDVKTLCMVLAVAAKGGPVPNELDSRRRRTATSATKRRPPASAKSVVHRDADPWSPIKPGDTIALMSLPNNDPGNSSSCLCEESTWSKTKFLLVINRWWASKGEATRRVILVPDIERAVLEIASRARDEKMTSLCPFGLLPKDSVSTGALSGFNARSLRRSVFSSPARSDDFGDDPVSIPGRVIHVTHRTRGGSQGSDDARERGCHYLSGGGLAERIEESLKDSVPSFGVLERRDSGRHLYYFVERLALYDDGFQDKKTRADTVDGCYMSSLNLPSENRRTSHHVSVLSLCPPGTDVRALYSVLLDDILQGAINGVDVVTDDGTEVRVFLDLSFILADTPAANKLLDVPGHKALRCCHLCNYVIPSEAGHSKRGESELSKVQARTGARYASRTTSGINRAHTRNMGVHQAVRDALLSAEEKEQEKKLHDCGITSEEGGGDVPRDQAVVSSVLPLHDFAKKYAKAASEDKLPRDADGRLILPRSFCPYRCLPPVPEHLLTGLLKCAVNYCLKALHSARDAHAVELYMQMYQRQCGIVVQSQMISVKDRKLHSMSMSALYGLSVVAERALLAAVDSDRREPYDSQRAEDALRKGIELVASISRIISFFWTKLPLMKELYGPRYANEFDALVVNHLRLTEELCKKPPSRSANRSSQDGSGGGSASKRSRRSAASDEEQTRACQWDLNLDARVIIDVPNVHRLFELKELFPFLGHGQLIAELMMEAKHQPNLRLLEGFCGNQNPHLYALEATVMNEYKARLCTLVPDAKEPLGSEEGDAAIRGLVRLLFGEDALRRLGRDITEEVRTKVLNVIGPDEFTPSLLRDKWMPLMSGMKRPGKIHTERSPTWKVPHKSERITSPSCRLGPNFGKKLVEAETGRNEFPPVVTWHHNLVLCDGDKMTGRKTFSGMYEFLRNVKIGSVLACEVLVPSKDDEVRDGACEENLFVKVEDEVLIMSNDVSREEGREKKEVRFFCVLDLYTVRNANETDDREGPSEDVARGRSPDFSREDSLGRDENLLLPRAAVCPVVFSDTDEVVRGYTFDRSRPLRVRGYTFDRSIHQGIYVLQNPFPVVDPWIWSADHVVILPLDRCAGNATPAAVFTRCEGNEGCGAYKTRSDEDNPKITHGPLCGPEKGGEFLIKDKASGFPHRST